MKRKISLLIVLLAFGFAQQEVYSQNKIDQKGKKQGYWSKSDKNGNKYHIPTQPAITLFIFLKEVDI